VNLPPPEGGGFFVEISNGFGLVRSLSKQFLNHSPWTPDSCGQSRGRKPGGLSPKPLAHGLAQNKV
jgi:hypothetical protein